MNICMPNIRFWRTWADSLRSSGALRDTVIVGDGGERLHAVYAAAPEPTDRTAVIVHGYTDNAVRMLMIGYLYNHDLGYNILLPDLHYHGESEGRAIRMGWKDRLDVLRWMDVANGLFGGRYTDGRARHLDGGRDDDDGLGGAAAALCEVFRGGLRLYERLGRVRARSSGESVRAAGLPAALRGQLAVRPEIRVESFREASALAAGGKMPRCRCSSSTAMPTTYVPTLDGLARFTRPSRATRSCGSCRVPAHAAVLPRQPGGIHAPRRGVRRTVCRARLKRARALWARPNGSDRMPLLESEYEIY